MSTTPDDTAMDQHESHTERHDRMRPVARGIWTAAAGALLASAILASLALADPVKDPGQVVDTQYTPLAKDTAKRFGWRQVGGAVFADSPQAVEQARDMGYTDKGAIPHTVDFFSLAFLNTDNGLAGGAACASGTPDKELATCIRFPVIYEYSRPGPAEPPRWHQVYRGENPGYIGGLAWLSARKAVAVGGTGCYPRRESTDECAPSQPKIAQAGRLAGRAETVAGDAQAWTMTGRDVANRSWQDISAALPAEMTGLTAMASSSRPGDCRATFECGFAGGLGQIWTWRDGAFRANAETTYRSRYVHCTTTTDSGCDAPAHTDSPFRVRSIAVLAGGRSGLTAVTSGCCYSRPVGSTGSTSINGDPTINFPRLLTVQNGTWHAGPIIGFTADGHPAPRAGTLPDSIYAVDYGRTENGVYCPSVVAAPGAGSSDAAASAEPASRVIGPLCGPLAPGYGLLLDGFNGSPGTAGSEVLSRWPELSSLRLVAGAGDLSPHARSTPEKILGGSYPGSSPSETDGIIDWAVGQLGATHQAAAYTTVAKAYGVDAPDPLACPKDTSAVPLIRVDISAQCQVDSGVAGQLGSEAVVLLPSYPLNAYSLAGTSGTSWAAGDRGALLSLGNAESVLGAVRGGDNPPKLGSGESTRLSDRQAYDPFRTILSSQPGLVPSLSAQPLTIVPHGQLVPGGSPNPRTAFGRPESVQSIAMSRDGTEGWAVGPSATDTTSALTTLYHFDGTRWSRCEPRGIAGVLPADPACSGLRELFDYRDTGVRFLTLARVPLEQGEDQSRASDFEVVAVARYASNSSNPTDAILQFKDGRWSLNREWSAQLRTLAGFVEIAFGGPDDGWIVANSTLTTVPPQIFRLTNGRWSQCVHVAANPDRIKQECLDRDLLLPITSDDAAPVGADVRGLRLTSAGPRVYIYGTRTQGGSKGGAGSPRQPVILYEDSKQGAGRSWTAEYDPKNSRGCGSDCANRLGVLNSLSVARGPDGSYTGWGIGMFGPGLNSVQAGVGVNSDATLDGQTPLIHLDSDTKQWAPVDNPGSAAKEYLLPPTTNQATIKSSVRSEIIALPGLGGSGSAVAIQNTGLDMPRHPMVWLNPATGRWEAFAVPFTMTPGSGDLLNQGMVTALAPDGRGGMWLTASGRTGQGSWFYHYTTQVPEPVFTEVPHPIREVMTATAAGGDGSFWVATQSGNVYRHDSLAGWDRVAMKGWDAGGVVQSPAYGIAVGRDGNGIAVGKSGRIAMLSAKSVALDPGSVLCSSDRARCPTTQTLRAAAIAPDGSALAGGDSRALVWRPPGGTFRPIGPLQVSASARVTAVSMPTPNRAWVATSTGDVMAGSLAGGEWTWTRENVDADGSSLSLDRFGVSSSLNGIALDSNSHGYAVGDNGLILERTGAASTPWKRVGGYGENLYSVALSPDGRGALIGGDAGLVLTRVGGRFEPARSSDYFDSLSLSTGATMGGVVGVAVVPGAEAGDVEAWMATQTPVTTTGGRVPPPGAILHYTNRPQDALMSAGAARAKPLPDTPAKQPGELELAAFGKSDCRLTLEVCPELTGSALANDVTVRRVRDSLIGGAQRPDLAIFTGDANDVGGSRDREIASLPTPPSVMHERWAELIASPLARAGIPMFGALGGQDLSHTQACEALARSTCAGTRTLQQKAGINLAWRQAFADAPAPWGSGTSRSESGLTFKEVSTFGAGTDSTPLAGASTHYALDVRRDGKKILRIVVLDTSLKTLSGTAAVQNPIRDQLSWLNDVLTAKTGREDGEMAVVVSETPSYAYENSAGATTDTLVDSAAFETLLVRNNVTAVVSGRLGWNGLYWLVAPGLHTPCPGGSYQPDAPTDPSQLCQASGNTPVGAGDQLAGVLEGSLSQPVRKPSTVLKDVAGQLANIPVAVAASAGGKFGPDGAGSGSASQGFWRGYTRIRLLPGTAQPPIIEQRPVFDWIGIQASDHTLTPGRRMKLGGYGREPLGVDESARYDEIDGPAITHRYDLVLADPAKPYLPKVDNTNAYLNHYVPVPEEIGATVDRQTGVVRYSGRGSHPPIYALAILSVGDKVATWPLVLAPRRSFIPQPPPRPVRIVLPPPPVVQGTAPAAIPPTPNTPIPTPPNLNLTFPTPASPPNLTLSTPQATPPPPPAPPPPPVSPGASALQISPAPVGLNVAPAATVIPPPAPPIQPAPPGGARREARQRQAAAAKSEEGGEAGAGQEESGGGGTQASTRLDQRHDLAFTSYDVRQQPSAWSRHLLYGGGLGIAALTLALGWGLLRPGPRRTQPRLPAPAWARTRRRQ